MEIRVIPLPNLQGHMVLGQRNTGTTIKYIQFGTYPTTAMANSQANSAVEVLTGLGATGITYDAANHEPF